MSSPQHQHSLLPLAGSTGALAVMTLISVAIGYAFKHVPEVLTTSAPVGEYLGAALLVYFGVRTLRVRRPAPPVWAPCGEA